VSGACSAAADDLAATRRLADALDAENGMLRERLETEKRTTHLLTELSDARKAETDALRTALTARGKETDAKDAVIADQAQLIAVLKQKRSSPWRRIGDILIGAAAALILK
jgi:septal ring factor EnvC (AmiA/AmiB activator)